jgi:ribosomal-protein-alanine N-acetyltransferase
MPPGFARRKLAMQIETERLRIRSLEVADAASLAAIWSDPEVTRHMGGPRDFAAIREGLEEDARTGDQAVMDLWTVVEKASGQVIGHCGFLEKDVDGQAEIELIYVFASDCWGKGYATEAALALRDHAFRHLGLRRFIALIAPGNPASARVAEKIGMQLEKETRRPSGKIMSVYSIHYLEPGFRVG